MLTVAKQIANTAPIVKLKGESGKEIIKDAADALDAYSYARNLNAPIGDIFKQQGIDGKTFEQRLNPRAKRFAEAMDAAKVSSSGFLTVEV